ncbi:urease accessory protein UreD [Ascidiaceihabitans sp.]|uniref:urease accessory protein UreD n=1 Tax=Ascidiaceihabitans sp. TaxID=1872644 RepID=UPI00329824FD
MKRVHDFGLDHYEKHVTQQLPIALTPAFQRARGRIVISATCARDGSDLLKISRLKDLRQEGSYRSIFPRPQNGTLEAVIINTAGGVTGGDRFATTISARQNARISVTTQAAERIYRATGSEPGHMKTNLSVAQDAQLFWLPQETILFEGCNLERSLDVDVHPSAKFLMLEPLVFGREASGEALRSGAIRDRVSITSDGCPIYLDRVQMDGDLATRLTHSAIAGGARAMASLVLVDPAAKNLLSGCRARLPQLGGASMLVDNVLVIRLIAQDSFALRKVLTPLLTLMTNNAVPKNWRL